MGELEDEEEKDEEDGEMNLDEATEDLGKPTWTQFCAKIYQGFAIYSFYKLQLTKQVGNFGEKNSYCPRVIISVNLNVFL